jgi:hypothetical protein
MTTYTERPWRFLAVAFLLLDGLVQRLFAQRYAMRLWCSKIHLLILVDPFWCNNSPFCLLDSC